MTVKIIIGSIFNFLLLCSGTVFGIEAPSADGFAYPIYELVIIRVLQGPIGFVIAAFCMAVGIYHVAKGNIPHTVISIIAAFSFYNISDLLIGLGAMY